MAAEQKLLIHGWRFYPASYSIVNMFQCLELLRRPGVRLWHEDAPYSWPGVTPARGLLPVAMEQQLAEIPSGAGEKPDAVLRMVTPYDFRDARGGGGVGDVRTFVFATSEHYCVPRNHIAGGKALREALAGSPVRILTPSEWSRAGFIRSGADPAMVSVVPHGVDTALFRPLPAEERQTLRKTFGWNGFTYLHVGTMSGNKGMEALLRAFAQVAAKHPNVRLVLKGLDSLYRSSEWLRSVASTVKELEPFQNRIQYFGRSSSFAEMAQLYQLADAYVSPYHAEGFNIPVLEAMACGLPVICTAGGPTDEFTTPDCGLRIRATRKPVEMGGEAGVWLMPDQAELTAHMLTVKENVEVAARARIAGPALAREKYTWKHVVDRMLEIMFPQ